MPPILFLSPIQSMADLAPDIAYELGLSIYVAVADDAHAEDVVRSFPDVEIVVSRGGLADRVQHLPGISVVSIAMTINELLAILQRLTTKGAKRIAIVSRANLFNGATGDFAMLGAHISIHPEKNEEAISRRVQQLVHDGVEAIIGCLAAFNTARALGVAAEVLDSGEVSIRTALQEAQRLLAAKDREKLQAAQLEAVIDNIDEAIIAITPQREVSFYNRHARRLCAPALGIEPDFTAVLKLAERSDKEQLTTLNGHKLIARRFPLELKNSLRGTVLTLTEVARIQASESKIRSSIYAKGLYARYRFSDLIGDSPALNALIERAKTYAQYDSNLLISGETGTGKEVFAQSIHNNSRRKQEPFVSVNIASLAPSLLESELFGYVEGAFTGARKGGKPGLFELAHRGTLFLDEIGELAPEIQSRLLRVLQEREIMRIGDDKIIPVDVRIISATNRDLFQQTQNGGFREDLYYRLHVVSLRIPPLRERPEDILPIFDYQLKQFAQKTGQLPQFTQAARQFLKNSVWPGNVRQLRNVAEVAAYSACPLIDTAQLLEMLGEPSAATHVRGQISIADTGNLKDMESEIIRHFLTRHSIDDVCQRLGISRVTLWRKTKRALG